MKLKVSNIHRLRLSTSWKLLLSLTIVFSFVTLVYASEYSGTPYLGDPINVLQGSRWVWNEGWRIEHEHHDRGFVGHNGLLGNDDLANNELKEYAVAWEVHGNTKGSRHPYMRPGEWAKYALYVPEKAVGNSDLDDQGGHATDFTIMMRTAARNGCTGVGVLEFTLDGREITRMEITNKDSYKVLYDTSKKFSFLTTGNVMLKIESVGDCPVYLDWFEFQSPTPSSQDPNGF